ncbi:hypothetical protein CMI42_02535 [Candidatus Pacearchaeota archaeon]|nr:hypothetical protein [Candidatus Pacearchaeota archaeon]|tara:strand:- start:185 stop:580 length:396 start_codon:yes stop_codon:yes gene_type:complete
MKKEDHINAYNEHRDTLNWAINKGTSKSQRTIGIHASRAIIELFSAYLHEKSLISIGFQINHRWFKSDKVSERFPDFELKDLIIKKLIDLELLAENLIYGSPKKEDEIKNILKKFNEIERMLINIIKENER